MKRYVTAILLCAALAGCADEFTRKQRKSAKEIEGLIQRNGTFIVYSLDPHPHEGPPNGGFHGYKVLGEKEITNTEERRDLLTKLAQSIRQNPEEMAACFDPRHGLRFKAPNELIDIVICFECNQAHLHGAINKGFLLTTTGRTEFNNFLDKHQVQRSTY